MPLVEHDELMPAVEQGVGHLRAHRAETHEPDRLAGAHPALAPMRAVGVTRPPAGRSQETTEAHAAAPGVLCSGCVATSASPCESIRASEIAANIPQPGGRTQRWACAGSGADPRPPATRLPYRQPGQWSDGPQRARIVMDAADVRLGDELAARLAKRARQLAPLGSLSVDAVELDERELAALDRLVERLTNTYPYGEPEYVGQMLKPPHPLAWAAYATAMLLNPNNHALDGGPATAAMEQRGGRGDRRDVRLRRAARAPHLLRHDREPRGALGRARAAPGRRRRSSARTRTTRTCAVRGARRARRVAARRTIAAGSTSTRSSGACGPAASARSSRRSARRASARSTPSAAIAELCRRHGARVHVDAAYGGFFALLAAGATPEVDPRAVRGARRRRLDRRRPAQARPAALRLRLRAVRATRPSGASTRTTRRTRTSPRASSHLGEISLECSRAGAAAAALWTTLEAFPLTRAGLGAPLAGRARRGAAPGGRARPGGRRAGRRTRARHRLPVPPRRVAQRRSARAASARSTRSRRPGGMSRSCASRPAGCAARHPWIEEDAAEVTTLRLVTMKPAHLAIADGLAEVLAEHLRS